MKSARIIIALAVLPIVLIILIVETKEYFLFWTRNESSARTDATKKFERLCLRYGYSPKDFDGPTYVGDLTGKTGYSFNWNFHDHPGEVIGIDVMYLPYRLDETITTEMVLAHPFRQPSQEVRQQQK